MLLLPLRRSHQRYPTNRIVSYCHKGKRFLTLTLNLGLGGMKIKTHYRLPEGELLDFNLVLGDVSIGLKGRTVYSDFLPGKQRVSGIQFVEVSERSRSTLHNYLAALEEWPKKGMARAGNRISTQRRKNREKR